MLSKQKLISFSFILCLILFVIVLYFGNPVYHSDDDVYLLYLLGGGFGDAPTNLLHYNFLMHPLLGCLIKELYLHFSNTNWYSLVLYFFSCFVLLKILLSGKKTFEAFVVFLIAFFVFEAQFLLTPSFTNTALIIAMAGIVMLLRETNKPKPDIKLITTAIILIVISTMFRLHTLIPLLLIASPVFIFSIYQKKRIVVYSLMISGFIIVFLNYYQQEFYSAKIPQWKSEEAYRTVAFDYYNNPRKAQNADISIEVSFLNNGLFWDKQFLSSEKIQKINELTKVSSALDTSNFKTYLYWYFINNRIFLCSFLFVFAFTALQSGKTNRILNIACLLTTVALLIYLLLFKKLPVYITPALILFYIFLTSQFSSSNSDTNSSQKMFLITKMLLSFAILVWSIIRLQKNISFHRSMNVEFHCAWQEINSHPDKLFVSTDDHFPLDYFSVWDIPKK